MKGLFITGTDTDIGKTMVTGAIAAAFRQRGLNFGVFKPLASGGAVNEQGQLIAADASFLMQAAGIGEERRSEVNPICLRPAFTPAVAAKESGIVIDMERVIEHILLRAKQYDFILVEGAGGITAPLWQDYLIVDLMKRLDLPSVVVSQPKLGAINHTVLTYEYAKLRGVRLEGFIFNRWEEQSAGVLEMSNIDYIKRLTALKFLGKIPLLDKNIMAENDPAQLASLAEQGLDIEAILRIIAKVSGDF